MRSCPPPPSSPRHRIGALIAFEQDAGLDRFVVGQGTTVDSAVQRELLVSLFLPESLNKLHDGAVVIRNLRIAKAGVFFPMPDTKVMDKSLGSRHRAALGITEETDAVVVVVSEERGTIGLPVSTATSSPGSMGRLCGKPFSVSSGRAGSESGVGRARRGRRAAAREEETASKRVGAR